MNRKLFTRLGAALLAGAMLFGALPADAPALPVAIAAEAEAAEGFSVAFSGSYAKVGQAMTVELTNPASGTATYTWTVDGAKVGTAATYTPTEDDLMKWISVTVTCGGETATAEMFFSQLPVVYINTEGGAEIVSKEEYINAEMLIQGNETYNSDTTTLYEGALEIRGRGNSTWGKPKKPYRLKLDKKTDVFGMGKNKNWVLLANYMDETLMRNTLAYNLSGAMGMEQMSTVFVDVVLNGDFVGNYQFCEQIRVDEDRVDIFDWEGFAEDSAAIIAEAEGLDKDTSGDLEDYMKETDMSWITSGTVTFNDVTYTIADYPDIEIPSINGGYLIELDEYYDEVSKFKTEDNQPIMFKNPEFVGTNADMIGFVQEYIQAFEDAAKADSYTATYNGETVHYSDLFDMDALVDYWLISEIFFNQEIAKKSTYMYKDIDGLMMMGPIWDMDWSANGEGNTYYTNKWATVYFEENAQKSNWYKSLIKDPYFFTLAQERYWEIRDNEVEDMLAELDSTYEMLKVSADANGERWGYTTDYDTYVSDLRDWFNEHLDWLDAQMSNDHTLQNSLSYGASTSLTLTLTLADADNTVLDADYSNTAPADGVVDAGNSLKVKVFNNSQSNTGKVVLYVNGRQISSKTIGRNTSVTMDIPSASLTARMFEKNVIEVQLVNSSGTVRASNYVTVKKVGECLHEHTKIVGAVAPTADAVGYTGDTVCNDCGVTIELGTAIAITVGDVDMDGELTVTDIATAKALVLNQNWNSEQLARGDRNGDGKLSILDIILIRNMLMSL